MQTSNVLVSIGMVGLALGFSPAASFDGTPSAPVVTPNAKASAPAANLAAPLRVVPPAAIPNARMISPAEALRSGTQALRDGNADQAVTALEYAAQQGMPGAMWKLGRMYADGEGVTQNKLRAFEYFRNLTKAHAYDPPGSPQSRFVASAFVSLGNFYLDGIPDTEVKSDLMMAHEMFRYAASYFGDSEAQYQLGRLYLQGQGSAKDPLQAARWFRLAANKGQRDAQATLGTMLFKGQGLQRQAAMGLFWLTVAKDGAGPRDAWILEAYKSAFAQASEDERALAYRYLTEWLQNRR
jgi:exopolysaccharide production negative regulator